MINKILNNLKLGFFNLIVKVYKKIKFRIIFDKNLILPVDKIKNKKINYKFYSKEILVRNILLKENNKNKLNFIDLGGRDGETYFLKFYKNFKVNKNFEKDKEIFNKHYNYYFNDLKPQESKNFVMGDICSEYFLKNKEKFINFFDVVYSNEVFEHLKKPWIASFNINKLLKVNGICVTICPFSQRYHESPSDFFRYTHQGLKSLFENEMEIEIIACGYDIDGRINDWNGSGLINDYVPEDNFGAWRENWYTILIFKKIKSLN